MSVTVLIADAQEAFRVGLASILRTESDITVIGEARNGPEVIDKALKLRPRVILMELNLALHEEGDALSRIREALPLSMIVIISESQEERDVFQALSLGAQGYLLKSCSHIEIAQAVRGVAEGEVILSPSIATNLVRETLNWKRKPKFSGREAEVLDLVGKGLTNQEIANRLTLSENTIKTYILRLREKLNLHSRLDLGMYASRRKSNTIGAELTSVPAVEAPKPSHETSVPIHDQKKDSTAPVAMPDEFKSVTVLCLKLDYRYDAAGQMKTEKIQEFLGESFDLMVEQINRCDGVVTWFNESGFIALFGIPVAREHAPQKALSAALSIVDFMRHHSYDLRERGINIDTRIGINTGAVLIGAEKIDSIARRYIPVGNTTSFAIKAQDMAPAGAIVVTEDTYSLTKHQFTFLPLSELEMKDIGKPIKTYSVLGYASDKSKIQLSAALGLTRFVGRHREIENLKHAFEEAKLDSVQVVGVSGEAGVGKSRLLLKFREELPNDEFTYVEGSCIHYGDSIPYLPLLQALRYYFDITEGEEEATIRRKMDEKIGCLDKKDLSLLPPLQDILSLKVEDEEYLRLEPVKKKERIFEAVRNLILLESRSRTMLIVLEDCHWTDSPSETLLAYLIDSLSNARVIFVLLYRPEWEHQFGGRSNYRQIRLKEFPTNTSAELIGFILGDGEADPALQQFVIDRAGGNPLFLEELLHNLQENNQIHKKQEKYLLSAKPSEIMTPASIQAIIAARIDRLKPDTKLILQTAAVIGREFDYRIMENIVEVRQELKSCLLNLQRNEFIYARDITTEPRYFFKHALTQEVAYQSLRSKTRTNLHKRVGREIEKQHPNDIEKFYEVLLYHYSKSDDLEKTAHYLKLLADKASSNCANWEAIRLYCDAIDALRKQRGWDNQAKELEIRLAMDTPLRSMDYPEGSLDNLQEAEKLAEELDDPVSKIIVHSKIGWCHVVRGDAALGLKQAEVAFFEAIEVEAPDMAVPVAINITQILFNEGHFKEVVRIASRTIALLESTHRESIYRSGMCNENVYCMLLVLEGISWASLGEFEKARASLEKSLSYARGIEDLASIAVALHFHGTMFWLQGDGKTAARYLQEALPSLEKVGNVMLLGGCWANLGLACLLQGDYQAAAQHIDKGLEIQQNCGVMAFLANFYWVKGWLETETGHLVEARRDLEESLRLAMAHKERCSEAGAKIYLGRAMGKGEDPNYIEAEQSLRDGMQIYEELGLKPWIAQGCLFLGELYIDTGHKAKALNNLKKAEAAFSEMGMDYWLQRTQGLLEKIQA